MSEELRKAARNLLAHVGEERLARDYNLDGMEIPGDLLRQLASAIKKPVVQLRDDFTWPVVIARVKANEAKVVAEVERMISEGHGDAVVGYVTRSILYGLDGKDYGPPGMTCEEYGALKDANAPIAAPPTEE